MPEVIPELVYVIGFFFAVVGYVVARGLLASWTHSLGYVLARLGAHLRFRIPLPFRSFHLDVGAPFRAADHAIMTALQVWSRGAEIQMGYCLHGMEKVARYTAQAIDFLADEVDASFEWLQHVKLRQIRKLLTAAVLLPLLLPRILRAVLPHITHGTVKLVRVVTHEITHTVTRVVAKTAAVAIPGAVALPGIRKEILGLTRRNLRLSKRLHRVEGLFGVAVLAAAMANVLGLPNWRCLTRGNVGKVARRLCGLSAHALEDVLGLLVDALILTNICQVITYLEEGFGVIEGPLNDFVGGAEAWLCYGNNEHPPLLAAIDLDLPPLTGVVLSLP